jgi:1,4-dihydroxy-2-naphthoate octaprenyltransferase
VTPVAGAIAILAAPLAWQATRTLFREYETRTLVKGNQGTIMLQATFGILMAVGMGASTLF